MTREDELFRRFVIAYAVVEAIVILAFIAYECGLFT